MTGRLKEKDEENETESDWKFAAMVIDRWGFNFIKFIKKIGKAKSKSITLTGEAWNFDWILLRPVKAKEKAPK